MKLLPLLTGIWCIFGNCFDIFVKYCFIGVWSCVFKTVIFVLMSSTHCRHVTQHVNVYINMSSLCLIFSGLHQNIQFMVFMVVTPWSLRGGYQFFWWNLVPPYSGLTLNMLVHTHVVYTTGKAITWTQTTVRIWELTHQILSSFISTVSELSELKKVFFLEYVSGTNLCMWKNK